MKRVSNRQGVVKQASRPVSKVEEILSSPTDPDMRLTLIQALTPIGWPRWAKSYKTKFKPSAACATPVRSAWSPNWF